MTALTAFGTNVAASTVSTANKIVTGSGGSNTSKNTKIGTASNYGELTSQGTTSAWAAAGSLPAQSGNGWLWDTTTLEGQTIAGANWTPTCRLNVSAGSLTADIIFRASIRHSDNTYSTIGTITLTGQSITTSSATYNLAATSLNAAAFTTGDKLYIDWLLNVTNNSTGSSSANVQIIMSNSGTSGVTVNQAISPGYSASTASTRTVTETSALQATLTRSASETAALSLVGTRTVTETAALTYTSTRTVTQSAFLSLSRIVTEDAALQATLTRTVTQDAALTFTLTRTVTQDASTSLSRSVSETGALSLDSHRTVTETASISAPNSVRTVPQVANLPNQANYAVTIGGVSVTIKAGTMQVHHVIGQRSTADFVVIDANATLHFYEGQQVIINDGNANRIFLGYVHRSDESAPGYIPMREHVVTCEDAVYLGDKRRAAKAYTNQTAGYIVNDLLTTYLSAEGVTAGTIQTGPTIVQATFNYAKVSDCLRVLAEKAGFIWNIDQNLQLQFMAPATITAPFSVNSDSDVDEGSMQVSNTSPNYRNRQWIRGIHSTTSAQTETRQGDGKTRAFVMSYPLNAAPTTFTLNGSAKTLGIKGVDTGKDFYWAKADPVIAQDPSGTVLQSTDTLSITYVGQFVAIVQSDDLHQQSLRATQEGGTTGIVEDVIDGPEMTSTDEAFQVANAKLSKFVVAGQIATFSILKYGLFPGQLLTVTAPEHDITNTAYLIEKVDFIDADPYIEYGITAILGPVNTDWVNFFINLANKPSLVDNLSLGSSGTLTTLESVSESWSWSETVTETVYACPICGNSTVCGNSTIVC